MRVWDQFPTPFVRGEERSVPPILGDAAFLVVETAAGTFTLTEMPSGALEINGSHPVDHLVCSTVLCVQPRAANVVWVSYMPRDLVRCAEEGCRLLWSPELIAGGGGPRFCPEHERADQVRRRSIQPRRVKRPSLENPDV